MIPFGPGEIPLSSAELEQRVATAFNKIVGNGLAPVVQCSGVTPQRIDDLAVTLTNSEIGNARMEKPQGFTKLGSLEMGRFQIIGQPARVFEAPVNLDCNIHNLPVAWARDDRGNLWLVPGDGGSASDHAHGNLTIKAATRDVENALREVVGVLAEKNGAKLKDLNLEVESLDSSSFLARVHVAASKFMMTAKLNLLGEIQVDPQMNLRIKQLRVQGDGAAGGMIANMLADKIKAAEGQVISLGQFAFAGASLRDIRLTGGSEIGIHASFGRGA